MKPLRQARLAFGSSCWLSSMSWHNPQPVRGPQSPNSFRGMRSFTLPEYDSLSTRDIRLYWKSVFRMESRSNTLPATHCTKWCQWVDITSYKILALIPNKNQTNILKKIKIFHVMLFYWQVNEKEFFQVLQIPWLPEPAVWLNHCKIFTFYLQLIYIIKMFLHEWNEGHYVTDNCSRQRRRIMWNNKLIN